MDVKFSRIGGPFSDDPPTGNAFMVHKEDIDKTVFNVSESAFFLLQTVGCYKDGEKQVLDSPPVLDKAKAERRVRRNKQR